MIDASRRGGVMRLIQLTGLVGAVIMVMIILVVLAAWKTALIRVRTAPTRRAPRWALGTLIAAFLINGVASWWRDSPWARWPLAMTTLLTVLAIVIMVVDIWRGVRHRPEHQGSTHEALGAFEQSPDTTKPGNKIV